MSLYGLEPSSVHTSAIALSITGDTVLPDGTTTASYSYQFNSTGGTAPYTWKSTGGSLPAGLTIDSSGLVGGTATSTGASSFTAHVTDNAQSTVSLQVSLTIKEAGEEPTHNEFFNSWVTHGDHFASWSLRSCNVIESVRANPNSTLVLYDSTQDASRMRIPDDVNGDLAAQNLYFPFDFTAPTGSNTWWICWDEMWSTSYWHAIHEDSNNNIHTHSKGVSIDAFNDSNSLKAWFKFEYNYQDPVLNPSYAYPHAHNRWSKAEPEFRGEEIGPDGSSETITNVEPLQPNNSTDYIQEVGLWVRTVMRITEGADSTVTSTSVGSRLTVWQIPSTDSTTASSATVLFNEFENRVPWYADTKGIKRMQWHWSPKQVRTNVTPSGWIEYSRWSRNLFVLQSDSASTVTSASLLVHPIRATDITT